MCLFWINGVNTLAIKADERVKSVAFTKNALIVSLMDGRIISVPLAWYPKLLKASPKGRAYWEICGGGYGIHWSEIDEDLSTQGLLRGAPAPAGAVSKAKRTKGTIKQNTARARKRRVSAKNYM